MVPADHPFAERIRTLIPVNGLEDWLQDEVLSQGELVEFKRKSVVFKEGDDDPYTLFLADGDLSLQAGDSSPIELQAGSGDALRALAQLRPRRYSARADTQVTLFRIKRAVLDHILSDEQVSKEGHSPGADGIEIAAETGDWMSRLLESELFTRLPPDHMQRFFFELEPIAVEQGEAIVEQGTPGDFLYIVAEGVCAVVRKARGGAREQELARLNVGDVFGEEALISEAPRNATVRALTPGMMMRLRKSAFEELVSKPVLRPVPYPEAEQLVAAGAIWLDVRFPEELESGSLPDAVNVPLNLLRLELARLDKNRTYITYCDSGGRASTAAFLMMRERFEVMYLAGGLNHSPVLGASSPMADDAGSELELAFDTTSDPASAQAAPELQSDAPSAPTEVQAPATPSEPHLGDTLPSHPDQAVVEAHAAELAALTDQLQNALKQLDDERSRHESALASLRTELQTLRTDRDAQAARSAKAVHAAREMKVRADDANAALNAERSEHARTRESLASTAAEGDRRFDMEAARARQEMESLTQRAEADRTRLEQALEDAQREHGEALRAAHEATRVAEANVSELEASTRMQLSTAEEAADVANAKVLILESEVNAANSRIAVLEARFEATRRTIMAQETEIQEVTREAAERTKQEEAEVDAIRSEIFELRAELDGERRVMRQELDTRVAELEARESETRRERERIDTEREQLVADRSAAAAEVDAERERVLGQLDARTKQLAAAEAALQANEQDWEKRFDAALAEEQQRLATELQGLADARKHLDEEREQARSELQSRQEAMEVELQELAEERSAFEQSVVEQRSADAVLVADLEAREETLISERAALEQRDRTEAQHFEQKLDALREQASRELAAQKATFERKLAEQGALLAEERRRLENQTVRLNEALESAAHAFAPTVDDAVEPEPVVVQAPAELPEQNERARVMSPKQIAELRRSMQAKMASLKK